MSLRASPRRGFLRVAAGLILVVLATGLLAWNEIDRARLGIVEARLTTATSLLREPAEAVLEGRGSAEDLERRLRDLGAVTGLRVTLIGPTGLVLADSEIPSGMPNLADRPEVVEAGRSGTAAAFRRSAVTGKETLYVAQSVVRDGRRLGTIRAATDRSEINGTLAGLQRGVALLIAVAGAAGAWIGARAGPRSQPAAPHEVPAADGGAPASGRIAA